MDTWVSLDVMTCVRERDRRSGTLNFEISSRPWCDRSRRARASAMERARALMGDSSKLMVDAATGVSTRAGRGLPRGEVDAETECRVRSECVSVTVCIP